MCSFSIFRKFDINPIIFIWFYVWLTLKDLLWIKSSEYHELQKSTLRYRAIYWMSKHILEWSSVPGGNSIGMGCDILDHYGGTQIKITNTLYRALGSKSSQSCLTSHQKVTITHNTATATHKYFKST